MLIISEITLNIFYKKIDFLRLNQAVFWMHQWISKYWMDFSCQKTHKMESMVFINMMTEMLVNKHPFLSCPWAKKSTNALNALLEKRKLSQHNVLVKTENWHLLIRNPKEKKTFSLFQVSNLIYPAAMNATSSKVNNHTCLFPFKIRKKLCYCRNWLWTSCSCRETARVAICQ